jgi:hypothetical protein
MVVAPDLGRDMDFLTRHARASDALSHRELIAVKAAVSMLRYPSSKAVATVSAVNSFLGSSTPRPIEECSAVVLV